MQNHAVHSAFLFFQELDLRIHILEEETALGFRRERQFSLPGELSHQLAVFQGDHHLAIRLQLIGTNVLGGDLRRNGDLFALFDLLAGAIGLLVASALMQ